jgi:hypothetical protein
MGAGAVLIPGGNDTLMLKSLPGLSPHAIPAFGALLFGIGVTLLFMRLLTGKTLKVVCTNDICQSDRLSTKIHKYRYKKLEESIPVKKRIYYRNYE